jgi:uncharacterized membrane protein
MPIAAVNWRVAALFVLTALPLGLFLAGVVPLGEIADEPFHVARADSLLHGSLLGHRQTATLPDGRTVMLTGAVADPELLKVISPSIAPTDTAPTPQHRSDLLAARALGWSHHPVFKQMRTQAGYLPIFYLPEALAIGTAKLLGFGPYHAYLAARLANLGGFLLAGAAALLLAQRGLALLFCTLTMPMTLNLAASGSLDALMIPSAVLAAALLTRRPPATSFSFWAAGVLIGCVAVTKPPYFPLAAMLLLPPSGRWRLPRAELLRRAAAVLGILLACMAWSWVIVRYAAVPPLQPPEAAGPLYPGPLPAVFDGPNLAAQVSVLMADPIRLLSLPLRQFLHDGDLLDQMIGRLGWLNVVLPTHLYLLWTFALVASVLLELAGPRQPDQGAGRLVLLLSAAAVSVIGVYLSQYLAWTPVGVPWIGGMEGRYFLPVLPLLAVAIPHLDLPGGRVLRRVLWVLPAAAAVADLFVVPRVIVAFYYLAG